MSRSNPHASVESATPLIRGTINAILVSRRRRLRRCPRCRRAHPGEGLDANQRSRHNSGRFVAHHTSDPVDPVVVVAACRVATADAEHADSENNVPSRDGPRGGSDHCESCLLQIDMAFCCERSYRMRPRSGRYRRYLRASAATVCQTDVTAHGAAGITIVAHPLIPGSTAAVAQTARPVVRTRARAKPAPSTRIAVVSDEVQDQTSSSMAGEATTRKFSVSPGIIVAVAGMISTRRTGGAAGVNSRALSGAQLAAASELSQKRTRVEARYNGIVISLSLVIQKPWR